MRQVILGMLVGGCVMLTVFCVDTSADFPDGAGELEAGTDLYVYPDWIDRRETACAYFSTQAKRVPAAMMIVLDRSSSMSTSGKWSAAQQAIVTAIDSSAFDSMSLGLLAYPSFSVAAPGCLLGLVLQVSCGVSSIPQVPLKDSGADKTTAASGVRKDIYQYLANHGPDNTLTDASPGYDALSSAISALQSHSTEGRRFVLLITDGGFSCTSVSSPTRPAYSDGLCPDWEIPDSVIQLLSKAHGDAAKPVSTFIVGVPGSDSTGLKQGPYATAPYHMRLALSTYAFAGSPTTVSSACDGKTFSKTGTDPAVPCHFDMTQGTFTAGELAKVIDDIRGKALGCTYKLPKVDDKNKVIDKSRVNVQVTLDKGKPALVARRKSTSDPCTTSGCWDFDSSGNVELLGKACTDLKAAKEAKVEILVGCFTLVK